MSIKCTHGFRVTSILALVALSLAACSSGERTDSSDNASTDNLTMSEIYKTTDAIEHMVVRDSVDNQGAPLRTLIFAQQPKAASGPATIFELHRTGTSLVNVLPGGMFQMAVRGRNTVYAVPQTGGVKMTGLDPSSNAYTPFSSIMEDTPDKVVTSVAASNNSVFVARDDGRILQLNDNGEFEEALDTHLNTAFDSLPRQLQIVENGENATLYWVDSVVADSEDTTGDTVIASVPLKKTPGGLLNVARTVPGIFGGIDRAYAVATDGKELFFAAWGPGETGDEGYVGKIAADGTSMKHLVEGVRRPSSIAIDENGVYFTTGFGVDDDDVYRGGAVMTIRRSDFDAPDGEAPVRCFPNTAGTAPAKLALSGTNVFWVENAAPTPNTHTGIFVWDKTEAWKNVVPCEAREPAHTSDAQSSTAP